MKKCLINVICLLLLFCLILTGCTIGGSNDNPSDGDNANDNSSNSNNADNVNVEKTLLTTLDGKVISKYYSTGSTLSTSDNGSVTIKITEGTSTGFIWDLSAYDFGENTEYRVEFKNLSFSGFHSYYTPILKLYWQDSSYNFLRYHHTDSGFFRTSVDNDNRFFKLESLTNDTYSVMFKFSHSGVISASTKKLYFDFQGMEYNCEISFDSVSIYYFK